MMLCIDTTLAVSSTYTKQNERHIVSIPSREIGDFESRIKQKTLSFYFSDRSLARQHKYTFLFEQCNAL